MKRRKPLAMALLIVLSAPAAHSQSTTAAAAEEQKPVFPQWARDLRRAEIVAFGSFPFMMFFSIFGVDTYRAANHDWDSRYLPWPAKSPGAIEMDTDEHMMTLGIAITGSLVVALADHIIVRFKRAKAEKQRLDLPEGELIILRKPWPPEEAAAGGTAPGGEAGEAAAGEAPQAAEGEAAP
ncbi:MAG: hypothetical protein LBU16_05235 [Treponema sp.]|jgi:hypothetical protein|nr:hypothetical protein [Treponema sp.]